MLLFLRVLWVSADSFSLANPWCLKILVVNPVTNFIPPTWHCPILIWYERMLQKYFHILLSIEIQLLIFTTSNICLNLSFKFAYVKMNDVVLSVKGMIIAS